MGARVHPGCGLRVGRQFLCSALPRAQPPLPTYIPQTQFNTGQDVVPVYEGWERNADGTFTFVFGYFNRNWKEELVDSGRT